VTGYLWDFANGNTSTTTDAQQVFTAYGDYPVSLTATNAAGCENITTKTVKVHARPVAAFLADGPPNSCSGTPTRLVDQSTTPDGDALTLWLWDFGDTSSDNIQTPTHIFSDAGRYNVSLTVTSAAGCSSNVIQPVDIYQSPSTDFSFSPACDDLPVLFTPPADNSVVAWYWEIGTSYYTASSPTHTFKSPGNYPLYLEVTALNGCESSRHDVIAVPVALTPDFSYLKNCVGEEAVLTDVTTGSDPVKSREWTFDSGETFSGSPVKFVFDKELIKTVTMKVTAASGCSYSVSKSITVLPPPVAGFKPDPSSGAYPLEVAFTNTSSGATHYLWNFNDGTDAVSTEVSPVHTFEGAGPYDVELIASNNQECTSSFNASIATVAPLPDADIELISLTPNADGSSKLIVTIHNKGNTILRNLPLDLDFGGVLSLREVLANRINPGAKFNFVFSTGIVNPADLQYICVSSDVPNDISPAGNRMCQGLGDALQAFHAYPNPASGSLNIEWVQSGEKNIRLSLVDTMGRIVIDARQTGSDGLNRRALDLSAVESGIYYLVIRQDGIVTTQKIAVSTRP
jgi:PKD repeat protein